MNECSWSTCPKCGSKNISEERLYSCSEMTCQDCGHVYADWVRRPLCIDLYAGLGGWAEEFLSVAELEQALERERETSKDHAPEMAELIQERNDAITERDALASRLEELEKAKAEGR